MCVCFRACAFLFVMHVLIQNSSTERELREMIIKKIFLHVFKVNIDLLISS